MTKSLYDFPHVYDQILCHRPEVVSQEIESICSLLKREGIQGGRILELACGTCAHSIELTKRGYETVGLDISPHMLRGATARCEREEVSVELIEADCINFSLESPSDAAIFMSETFPLITTYEDLEANFESVHRALRPGGLYIVDVDAHRYGIGTDHHVWGEKTLDIEGGKVDVWHESFPGDWVQGTSRMKMHCRIYEGDTIDETTDEWILRCDSPWHLELLVESMNGWALDGFYSWHDLSTRIDEIDHYFMVVKRES